MNNVICPKCKEKIFEEPGCKAMGIITCDSCKEKITWECDGEKTLTKTIN